MKKTIFFVAVVMTVMLGVFQLNAWGAGKARKIAIKSDQIVRSVTAGD